MTATDIIAALAPLVPGATLEPLTASDSDVTPSLLVSRDAHSRGVPGPARARRASSSWRSPT